MDLASDLHSQHVPMIDRLSGEESNNQESLKKVLLLENFKKV